MTARPGCAHRGREAAPSQMSVRNSQEGAPSPKGPEDRKGQKGTKHDSGEGLAEGKRAMTA